LHYGGTTEFPPHFQPVNEGEAYILNVFNFDKTILPSMCLPSCTFIFIV